MRYPLTDGERAIGRTALALLAERAEAAANLLEEIELYPLNVNVLITEAGRALEELSAEPDDIGTEVATDSHGALLTALHVLRAKCEKVAKAQAQLSIRPEDTNARIVAITDMLHTLHGQGTLFEGLRPRGDIESITFSSGDKSVTLDRESARAFR